ncbi:MAG: hypothetical protein DRN81_07535 [Thermoproteota archaeon]|nr:MAG: hypothetical protein DRN81_07535 [Candidatus Korarchaeota archaeon]
MKERFVMSPKRLSVDRLSVDKPRRPQVIRYSSNQVEAAVLRANGLTYDEIAKRMGKSRQWVSEALKRFESVVRFIRDDVQRLQKAKYFEFLFDRSLQAKIIREHAQRRVREFLEKGLWPPTIKPPYGFRRREDGLLMEIPELQEVVAHIFYGYLNGKSQSRLASETGLSRSQVLGILRNPVYKMNAEIRWAGKLWPAAHKGFIPDDVWEAVQSIKLKDKIKASKFGLKFEKGQLVPDREKVEVLRNIFGMRAKGKLIKEISEEMGIPSPSISNILKSQDYLELGIIDHKTWRKVQEMRIPAGRTAVFIQKEKMMKRRRAIHDLLLKSGELTRFEIAKKLGLHPATVEKHLKTLEKLGFVSRTGLKPVKRKVNYKGRIRIQTHYARLWKVKTSGFHISKTERGYPAKPQTWPKGSAPDLMKKRGREIRAKLLETIRADSNITNSQLAERLGISESTVRYHLARLREAGLLEK